MPEADVIGSNLKLAYLNLAAVKKLSVTDRTSPMLMFYAAENILMAVLTSEKIDVGSLRRTTGNHQLDRMLDALPDACAIKPDFEAVIVERRRCRVLAFGYSYRQEPNFIAPLVG